MQYSDLVGSKSTAGSVADWLNNSTIVGDVPEIILEAEAWIYRRLRHWQMLTVPTYGTMTVGQDNITNPSDMLEPHSLFYTGQYSGFIPQRTPQDVVANFTWVQQSDGTYARTEQQPMMYYFDQSVIRFDSVPDLAYTYGLIYYQQPAALSVSNTNFITNSYPRLLRAVIMMMATEWAKDSGVGSYDRTYWVQVSQDEIEKAQQESDRARRGTEGGAILIGGGVNSGYPSYSWGLGI